MTYRNPILPGFNPDPSMIFHNDKYYLVTSSFEYFPGIPIYCSKDLIEWTLIGHVLSHRSQLDLRGCEPGGGIYAPTLRYNRFTNRFYVCVAAQLRMRTAVPGDPGPQPRGFYVWTDDLESNNWSEPIYTDCMGIDQDLFFDDDGKTYFGAVRSYPAASSRFNLGTFYTEIDLETGKSKRPSTLVRVSDTEIPVAEGPHIFKRDGVYYLIVAEGGTEIIHQEWVLRSTVGPFGPWEVGPRRREQAGVNPIVFNDEDPKVRQTGHMDICEGRDGKWWAVFLALRPQVAPSGDILESQLGRETFLCPLSWTPDGWPLVNEGKKVSPSGLASAGLTMLPSAYSETKTFKPGQDLSLDGWYSLRTPLRREYSLDYRPGSLTLWGGPLHFRVDEATTMLLVRQKSFIAEWRVDLEFDPRYAEEEAGIAVWWSKWNYASLTIRGSGGKMPETEANVPLATGRELVLRTPDLGTVGQYQEKIVPLASDSSVISIRVVAEPTRYSFHVKLAQTTTSELLLGSISSVVLTRLKSPIEWMFTGTHFALLANGAKDEPSFSPAIFSNMRVKGEFGH